MKHDNRFIWFDLIRGISALLVCAGHLRAAILVDYSEIQNKSLAHSVFYLLTGLGHQAVMVFFVLSGFFVGGSILKKGSGFKWLEYALARITRLWIVLIPSLLFTLFVDHVISRLDSTVLSGKYYSIWNSGPKGGEFSNSIVTFFGNIGFLQNILVPIFGINSPLWSLANEFWYYVIFPLFAFALGQCCKNHQPTSRIVASLLALGLLKLLPGIREGFIIWNLGVIVWLSLPINVLKQSLILTNTGLALFAISLFYSKSTILQSHLNFSPDLSVGLGFSVLAITLIKCPLPAIFQKQFIHLSRGASEFSYSLYLFHFPFVLLIATAFYRTGKIQPNVFGFLHYFGWLGLIIILGIAFWWLFEKRTNTVRKLILNLIYKRQ